MLERFSILLEIIYRNEGQNHSTDIVNYSLKKLQELCRNLEKCRKLYTNLEIILGNFSTILKCQLLNPCKGLENKPLRSLDLKRGGE